MKLKRILAVSLAAALMLPAASLTAQASSDVVIGYSVLSLTEDTVLDHSLKITGTLNLNGYKLAVLGDLLLDGSAYLSGGEMVVQGDLRQTKGELDIGGGRLTVKGDYRLAYPNYYNDGTLNYYSSASGALLMDDPDDYMCVEGDVLYKSLYGNSSNKLTAGTLELKGNFEESGATTDFDAKEDHRVIFSGSGIQTVTFSNAGESGFGTLYATPNTNVVITQGRILTAENGTQIKDFVQYGSFDLKGNKMTVSGDMTEYGFVSVDSGELDVGGNYYHYSKGLDLWNGTLNIAGNYDMRWPIKDSSGEIVDYSSASAYIQMDNPDDYMCVGGDFYINSVNGSSQNMLTNGTLELRGDFEQRGSNTDFDAGIGHKVLFTGTDTQNVEFSSAGYSGFGTLITSDSANPDVNITKGRILRVSDGAAVNDFVQYGTLSAEDAHFTVTGDFAEQGDVNVSGTMDVKGSFSHYSGTLDLEGGRLNIDGDYDMRTPQTDSYGAIVSYTSTFGAIRMEDDSDYMLVGGDFYINSVNGSSLNILTNGTLELRGNFEQSGSDTDFDAGIGHKVLFTGTDTQNVEFSSAGYSGFGTLITSDSANSDVNITKGRILKVSDGAAVNDFVQYGTLSAENAHFIVAGDFTERGNVTVGGTVDVKGNFGHYSGTLNLGGGRLNIDGDYNMGNPQTDSSGAIVGYTGASAAVCMENSSDYMLVGADFYINSVNSSSLNKFTAGTLELRGDFSQCGSVTDFDAGVGHKVLFTGTRTQTVDFESAGYSGFGTVITSKNANSAVNITKGRILSAANGAAVNDFVQYGDLDLAGNTFTVRGNMTQNGNVTINGGELDVLGNYNHCNKKLALDGGSLKIDGDYGLRWPNYDSDGNISYYTSSSGYVEMDGPDDYMLVGGDFFINSLNSDSLNKFTNGTLELRGDFTQEGNNTDFNAKDDHKVIFSGSEKQTTVFDSSYSGFSVLYSTPNTDVDVKGRISTVSNGTALNNFVQYGDLDLAGNKLTIMGNFTQNGNVSLNGGKLDVRGNYNHLNKKLDIGSGILKIDGDYDLRYPNYDSEGNILFYSSASGYLEMDEPNDYMQVNGDFYINSISGESLNKIQNGTLELRGDFTQGGNSTDFKAVGQHKTVLTGEESQNIYFDSNYSFFNILAVMENKADPDVFTPAVPAKRVITYYGLLNMSELSEDLTCIGRSVTVNESAICGSAPYIYYLYIKAPGQAVESLVETKVAYGTEYTLVPDKEGEYQIRVVVQDCNGALAEKTMTLTCEHVDELVNNSSVSSASVFTGEEIVITGAASGGKAPLTYSYYYRKPGAESWTRLGNEDTASDTQRLTPDSIGTYKIKTVVRDAYGHVSEKVMDVIVNDSDPIINTSTINATVISLGTRIIYSGSAEGGNGEFSFEYMYKRTSGKVWKQIAGLSEDPTKALFMPTAEGTFDIRIVAKDSTGRSEMKSFVVNVVDGKSKAFRNNSTISSTGIRPSTRVYLYGAASGSEGYRYAYYYKRPTGKAWLPVGEEFGTAVSASFKPVSAGDIKIKIDIIDKNNELVSRQFALTVSDDYKATDMVNKSTVSTQSALPGTRVYLYGAAEKGTGGYTYAYYYKNVTGNNWTAIGTPFTDTESASVKLRNLGDYILRVEVKDSSGAVVSTNFDVEITDTPRQVLVNKSTVSSERIAAASRLYIYGAAEGGEAPYTYNYYYKSASSSSWKALAENTAETSTSIKLKNVGSYNFKVTVSDSEGTAVEKIIAVAVVDPSEEDFTQTMYDYSYAGMKSALKRVSGSEYISAADYGIAADSQADQSAAITNAIYDATSSGKFLYFPEGKYYIKNVKIYNANNVRICGAGEKTVLMTADDAIGDNWDIGLGLYNCNNCIVRNITFDGNNKNVAGNLEVGVLQLRIDNCTNASVYGCRFRNNNSGNINVVGQAEGLKIFYCDFLNSDCSVVVMPGYITNGYICNNFIDGQEWEWSEPISLYNAPDDDKPNRNVIISGNDIRNHTQGAGGVFITYPSKDIYVLNNYFYRCGAAIGSGSRLQDPEDDRGSHDVVCRGNVIDSPTWHGIALLYSEDWIIENNTIYNITDGFAVYLTQCYGNTIINNSIDGSIVYEENCSGNIISGNS